MLFVVLLDAGVLVVNDQGWGHFQDDNAGARWYRLPPSGSAVEDQLHLLWSTEIEVLMDHVLEKQAAVLRLVKYLGQRELGLQNREVVAIASFSIDRGERVRQQAQPFAQQGIDLLCR